MTRRRWFWRLVSVAAAAGLAAGQTYRIDTFAGAAPDPGDGGPASAALLYFPHRVAIDKAGNIFISDYLHHRVRRVDAAGNITTVAGTGEPGFYGDGGRATGAQLSGPAGLALDRDGNLYIADSGNNQIRMLTLDGRLTTVAGTGVTGSTGNGGPARAARLNNPRGVAVDPQGTLYIADSGNNRIRRVAGGVITAFAGNGAAGFSGDGGPATSASLRSPDGVALDAQGNLLVADTDNNRIRRIDAAGIISTYVGTGFFGFGGDGGPPGAAAIACPYGVAVGPDQSLLITDACNLRVRRVNPEGTLITTVAGGNGIGGAGDGGQATAAQVNVPIGVAFAADGTWVLADTENHRVRRVDLEGVITTIAGRARRTDENLPAANAELFDPRGLAMDAGGNLYVADRNNHSVWRITPGGARALVAGGQPGFGGDGGQATQARLLYPKGVAVAGDGTVYISDSGNDRVRRVREGIITTVAGTGVEAFSGEGAPGTQAALNRPGGLAVDASGNLYIADTGNHRVRRLNTAGIIETVAGTGVAGSRGDGGPARLGQVYAPFDVAVAASGDLYIADASGTLRRVSPDGTLYSLPIVELYSGGGLGPFGDLDISLSDGVAVDSKDNVFLADSGNNIVRQVRINGAPATLAGTRMAGDSGDGGPALQARLNSPEDVVVGPDGVIYFTDSLNHRIRRLRVMPVTAQSVVNAASYAGGGVAPGEIITIFGSSLGPAAPAKLVLDGAGRVATLLAGTRVLFDGVAAPLIFTSAGQVSAIVPFSVAGKTSVSMVTEYNGERADAVTVPVFASVPGLFTTNNSGSGQGAILNQDGSLNGPDKRAARGSIVVLYATGMGAQEPAPAEGEVSAPPLGQPKEAIFVRIGGAPAEVLYAGPAPGAVAGLFQINVRVPASAASGAGVSVDVATGDWRGQSGVTLAIE